MTITEQYETIISSVEKLNADLTVKGNLALADLLFAVEQELIWQMYEYGELE